MPSPRRLAAALSLAALAACATRPPGDPPSADVRVPFTRTAAAAASAASPVAAGADWRMQALYLATDVKGAGTLTGLRFVRAADNATPVTCPDVSVRLGHSTLTALGTTFDSNVDASSLTTVAAGITLSIPVGTSGSWFDVPLQLPYEYDGLEGLVVDLETPAACSGTITLGTLNAPGQRLVSAAPDAGPATFEHGRTTGTVDASPPAAAFRFAGGDLRVNAGVTGGNYFPWASFPRRVQMLELAGDLAAGAGPITGVGFEVEALTTAATYTYTLRLGHTTRTALDADWESNATSWVTVATSVTLTFPQGAPPGTWIWMPMPDGPFQYDGASNVVVDLSIPVGNDLNYVATGSRAGARNFGAPGTATGTVDGIDYHVAFRFKGAPVYVTRAPLQATPWVGVGTAGQFQQLIRPFQMGASGTVTGVALRAALPSTQATIPITIYLGQTSRTALGLGASYASNMDESVLAFQGTATIPGGLSAGDWIDLPISSAFQYDARRSLVVLLMHETASPASNASAFFGGADTVGVGVGRTDDSVDVTGTPTFAPNAAVDFRIRVQ